MCIFLQFEFARWKRQIPFNETSNLNAKEAAKFNQTTGRIFFTSSHRGVLRRTEFSQANTVLDFSTVSLITINLKSVGKLYFITFQENIKS